MAWPPFTRAGHDRSALRYASDNSQSAKTGAEARGHVGFDAGKKAKGRKRHILVDRLGLILRAEAHSAGARIATVRPWSSTDWPGASHLS